MATLNEILGTRIAPEHRPSRPGDVRDSQADLLRIRAALGYYLIVGFEEGLRRTVAASVGPLGDRER